MSYTFSDYKTEGARYVNSPEDDEALGIAGSGLNSAVNKLNNRNWSWRLETSGFTLVASTTDYVFPSGVRTPSNLALMDSTGTIGTRVAFLASKEFEIDYPNYNAAGSVHCYTFVNSYPSPVVRLSAAPTASEVSTYPSGQFEYYSRIPNLSSDAGTLGVPPEVEEVIMDYVRSYTAQRYDQSKYAIARQDFNEGFRQLVINETEDQGVDF